MKEKHKLKARELIFLINNFFFQHIKLSTFEKKYFPFYLSKKYDRNEILFEQNDDIDSLYFVKSGEIDITFNGSLLDIYNLLNYFLPFFL